MSLSRGLGGVAVRILNPCYCPDTVQHILLDCTDLYDIRFKYYRDIYTMEKLFNEMFLILYQ